MKNKITLNELVRDKTKEEIRQLKVKVSELQASETALKTESADLNGKY